MQNSEPASFLKSPTQVSSWAEIVISPMTQEKALRSLKVFHPGEIITSFIVKKYLDFPNYLSIQMSEEQHILVEPEYLHYINHSCQPNVFFDVIHSVVTCLQEIKIGDELTFFYPSTEWSMSQEFICYCNSLACLGKIQGAAYLSAEILSGYRLSDHIHKKVQ